MSEWNIEDGITKRRVSYRLGASEPTMRGRTHSEQ